MSQAGEPGTPSAETSQKLLQMILGFRVTQIIYVAAKLGIADLVSTGPKTAATLAEETGTHAPTLYRLLRALASVGIFAEDQEGRFALTPLARLLQSGVPGSLRSRAVMHGGQPDWGMWGELLYSVRTGEPAFHQLHGMSQWDYRARHPELNSTFNDVMANQTAVQATAIVEAYDFSGVRTLVDVGGGHGALLAAILKSNPQLHGILCDTPHVVAGAGPVLEAAGIKDRCEIAPCDFFTSVPAGADLYILKLVIHDWDDSHAVAILKNCRAAIPAHGRLLLIENVIAPGNNPDPAKLLDLQMLLVFGGQERTEAEYRELFHEAGFKLTGIIPTKAQINMIEGVPV